ncbi:uncharacterized protein RHOBADRAFT_66184, partial [Rhodotorula graminis WP1]
RPLPRAATQWPAATSTCASATPPSTRASARSTSSRPRRRSRPSPPSPAGPSSSSSSSSLGASVSSSSSRSFPTLPRPLARRHDELAAARERAGSQRRRRRSRIPRLYISSTSRQGCWSSRLHCNSLRSRRN